MKLTQAMRLAGCAAGWTIVSLLRGADAGAAAASPEQFVQDGVAQVMAIVYDTPATDQPLSVRVRPVLEKDFDLDGITRRAVGPAWRQFTPEQQQKVTELFSEMVLRTYADRFEPKERPKITYRKTEDLGSGRVEVPSSITYQGQVYAVGYRLQQKEGRWRVYDVIIEGVSMVSNYRGQFDAILQKGGAKALIKSLEENVRHPPAAAAPTS